MFTVTYDFLGYLVHGQTDNLFEFLENALINGAVILSVDFEGRLS